MSKFIAIFIMIFVLVLLNHAVKASWKETDYQTAWCAGEIEHRLPDGARVDCLQEGYAIEVDYAHKWAESIGQSLFYASQTGFKPGILLIVDNQSWSHVARLTEAIQASGRHIRVWFIRRRVS